MLRILTYFLFIILAVNPVAMNAQDFTEQFTDRFYLHFDESSQKLIALAEAMPDEIYEWTPDGEAMSVARVFMHLARHNYMLPDRYLSIPAPDDVSMNTMERITEKERVVAMLKSSTEHVYGFSDQLTEELLNEPVVIFGEETQRWAALMLLITHMNEHLGQAVSYARMNGIVPPWSD